MPKTRALRLVIRYDGRRVLTEVFDGDPRLPVPPDHPGDVGGRGLFLVDRLSLRWGSEAVGIGKRVWAELAGCLARAALARHTM